MSKRSIYFVQVGFAFDKSVYLPYATGCLAAYSLQFKDFRNNYEIKPFVYKREKIGNIVAKVENPSIVAFSNYAWNTEFNKTLASAIKEKYPDCVIVFGGHSVPNYKTELLELYEYIDYLIFGEGEETFYKLAMSLAKKENVERIPNIAFRSADGEYALTEHKGDFDISDYPSPYLTGIFDDIVNNAEGELLSVIESNRGCPYKCAYCDWSAKSKVRFFPIEKVEGELKWLSDNKIEYCFCADANFGMFKRDVKIAEYAIGLKKDTGYPDVFRPCYAKESDENVFEICSKFNQYHMDKGATMAYQSLSDSALKNVNRKNLTMEHFADIVSKYNHAKIPTYSELILGLPGETYDSFCDGLCKLLEAGQHNSVSVYQCEVLPNSIMGSREYREKFGIVSKKVKFNHIHSAAVDDEVTEYSEIVMATDSMSEEMWIKSNLFSVCLQCFHSLGLLRCFSIFSHYESGTGYRKFFDMLLDFLTENPNTVAGKILNQYYDKLTHSLEGDWNYYNPTFGNIVWFFEEGLFLELMYSGDDFWNEIMPFLESLGIETEILNELISYQKLILRRPGKTGGTQQFNYDFLSYFETIYSGSYQPLKKKKITVTVKEERAFEDWYSFAKNVVWFGRRKGATLYTSDKDMYNFE
jgi:radical SAM superfamily enzyme YgiQ (UPF0313 family)